VLAVRLAVSVFLGQHLGDRHDAQRVPAARSTGRRTRSSDTQVPVPGSRMMTLPEVFDLVKRAGPAPGAAWPTSGSTG
jgi:hypothetical protein